MGEEGIKITKKFLLWTVKTRFPFFLKTKN